MANDINLFEEDNSVQMPSFVGGGTQDNSTVELSNAILGDTVKSVALPEDTIIEIPNYAIDFRSIESIAAFQLSAIDSMLTDDGDIAVYAFIPNGMVKLGHGIQSTLDRLLPIVVNKVFGEACKIYVDIEPGKGLVSISEKDITSLKLKL